jgi:hypothetical protein
MNLRIRTAALFAAVLPLAAVTAASAADAEGMKEACRTRAARVLGADPVPMQLKYEGQRTDKTHAVNGSAAARGDAFTFQCSFAKDGKTIARFVVNEPKAFGEPKKSAAAAAGGPKKSAGSAGAPAEVASMRAGQGKFDAHGQVPCAQGKGKPLGQCPVDIARDPGGTATVKITRPDGRSRIIFFEHGKALGADTSQADGYPEFKVQRKPDLFVIELGAERYEIPDAVVFGG